MNGEFIDQLVAHLRPEERLIGGHSYILTNNGAHLVKSPCQEPLVARTLTAVVDFVQGAHEDLVVHVEGPASVCVYGRPLPDGQRPCYIQSVYKAPLPSSFFGQYHEAEMFVIALQSTFTPTNDLPEVLRITGTLESEAAVTLEDDGVSQKATVRQGITKRAEMMIRNPVRLSPYRTFSEVDDPVSSFILRLKGGGDGDMPRCALFLADGNQWELEAIESIKAWLRFKLPDETQILA